MKELFKTMRLAFYVLALPLVITAMVSAKNLIVNDEGSLVDDTVVSVETLPPAPVVTVDVPDKYSFVLKVDSGSGVSGRVALMDDQGNRFGAQDLDVTLNRRGTVVAASNTDSSGVFRFDNVGPGSYTFIAANESAVSAMGVYVINANGDAPADGQVQMDVVAIGGGSLGPARDVLNREIDAAATIEYGYMVDASVDSLPVSSGSNRIALGNDGSLQGHVAPLDWVSASGGFDLTGNTLMLLSQGRVAYEISLQADGIYSIPNVEPGVYDMVSYGPHGNAAVCIEVVDFGTIAQIESPIAVGVGNLSTTVQQGAGVVLTEPGSGTPIDITIEIAMPQGFGDGGGGFGGGGGGFGGGGGGFGGFGDLIGLGIGAWVLTEIFDSIDRNNNNGNVVQQPVVVPPVVIPPASPSS